MSEKTFRELIGACVIFGGLYGVHVGVEYSGWVIFIGALLAL